MIQKLFILTGLLFGGTILAQTDSINFFSLKQAQDYALQNNRNVRSSQMELEIAKKQIWETTAIGLPQVSVSANYQHNFTVPEFPFGGGLSSQRLEDMGNDIPLTNTNLLDAFDPPIFVPLGAKNNTTIDFTLSQLIFNGEYIVGLQASKVFRELSEKKVAKSENDVRESIANSYYLILVLDRNTNILKESMDLISKTHHEMNQMFQQGFLQETDADRISIIRSQLENTIFSLDGQAEVMRKLLKMQLGMNFEDKISLTDSIEGLLMETNLSLLENVNFDIEKNIDFQLASYMTDISNLSLRREKVKFLPTLAAFYRHEEQTNAPAFNFMPKDILGVSMNFNLLSSGQRISRVSQAKLQFEKSKLDLTLAEQGLIMQFESAKNDYITAYKSYMTSEENYKLSKKIFEKSLISYREGLGTSLELIQNHNEFLTNESAYLTSITKVLSAKARLDNLLNQ